MWTEARLLGDQGLLVAKTRTQSTVLFGGFHGAVQVVLLDANQKVLDGGVTEKQTFGVDGRFIGVSDRTDVWSYQFDPQVSRQAVSLGVRHTGNTDWLSSINGAISWIEMAWDAIVSLFNSSGNGDGGTGGEDPTTWEDSGPPWSTYQALSAPGLDGWNDVGHANNVRTMTTLGTKLLCSTGDNQLWIRDPILGEVDWTVYGQTDDVVGLTSVSSIILFCADSHNRLFGKLTFPTITSWIPAGHANNVVDMTTLGGQLVCATSDNHLWYRPPSFTEVNWTEFGVADNVVGLAASADVLYCIDAGERLWKRSGVLEPTAQWNEVGKAPHGRALAATSTHLFMATSDNNLLACPLP